MLYPTTMIKWMDVKSQKVYDDDITRLFSMYSHKLEQKTSEYSEVCFDSSDLVVKISDWMGWTNIIAIKRYDKISSDRWVSIKSENYSLITMTKDSPLILYNPNVITKGFHGEVLYDHVIYSINELSTTHVNTLKEHKLRVRNIKSENSSPIDFIDVNFTNYDSSNDIYTHGYDIITKSISFNANGVQLFGHVVDVQHIKVEFIVAE